MHTLTTLPNKPWAINRHPIDHLKTKGCISLSNSSQMKKATATTRTEGARKVIDLVLLSFWGWDQRKEENILGQRRSECSQSNVNVCKHQFSNGFVM